MGMCEIYDNESIQEYLYFLFFFYFVKEKNILADGIFIHETLSN